MTSLASSVFGTSLLPLGQAWTAAKSPRAVRSAPSRRHSSAHTSSGCSRSRSAWSCAVRLTVTAVSNQYRAPVGVEVGGPLPEHVEG